MYTYDLNCVFKISAVFTAFCGKFFYQLQLKRPKGVWYLKLKHFFTNIFLVSLRSTVGNYFNTATPHRPVQVNGDMLVYTGNISCHVLQYLL